MKHTRTVKQMIDEYTCDFCGTKNRYIRPCPGCGKDVCPDCGTFWHHDPWDGGYNGDSPPLVCAQCDGASKPFSEQAAAARIRFYELIDALKKEWAQECKPGAGL